MDNSKENISKDIKKLIDCIEKDINDHKCIINTMDENTNRIIHMLESQDRDIMKIQDGINHWKDIAHNTNEIAITLNNYGQQNAKLIDAVAGKKQVPLSVFVIILIIIGIASLSMLVSITNIQLLINPNQIEIKRNLNNNGTSEK